MSGTNIEELKENELANDVVKNEVDGENAEEDLKASETNDDNPMPSPQQEEEVVKKKYGGILPKKRPLISKDHERAFFDSADWALGKQGAQKPKGPVEALRPKLQPTPHQQMRTRRSAYAPADDNEDVNNDNTHSEDQSNELDGGNDNHTAVENKNSC